jgi:hypothetical protein
MLCFCWYRVLYGVGANKRYLLQGKDASPEAVQQKFLLNRGLLLLLVSADEMLDHESSRFRHSVIPDEDLRVALAARCLVDARLAEKIPGRSYQYFPRHMANIFGSMDKEELDTALQARLDKNLSAWKLAKGFRDFEEAKLDQHILQSSPAGCGHGAGRAA